MLTIPAAIWSDLVLAIELVLFLTVGQVAYYVLTQRRTGIFSWLAMMSSAYRQRLGDRWGKTYVVAD